MAALLADPFGRQLLSLLTADYGLPGDPRRRVLLQELRHLQQRARDRNVPRPVALAIRSALGALRAEIPVAGATGSAAHHPDGAAAAIGPLHRAVTPDS